VSVLLDLADRPCPSCRGGGDVASGEVDSDGDELPPVACPRCGGTGWAIPSPGRPGYPGRETKDVFGLPASSSVVGQQQPLYTDPAPRPLCPALPPGWSVYLTALNVVLHSPRVLVACPDFFQGKHRRIPSVGVYHAGPWLWDRIRVKPAHSSSPVLSRPAHEVAYRARREGPTYYFARALVRTDDVLAALSFLGSSVPVTTAVTYALGAPRLLLMAYPARGSAHFPSPWRAVIEPA
jgi:hypothetical protein